MDAFVDHEFYINTFGGVEVPAADFGRLALKASFEVNRQTLERAEKVMSEGVDADLMFKIRMATCAVIEVMTDQTGSGRDKGVASEKIGDHAVSYAGLQDVASFETEQVDMSIRRYLELTGLMFRGVG